MSRVVHFEIHADDPERAMQFYRDVFAWQFEDYSGIAGTPYWGVITGPDSAMGINGGLLKRPCPGPAGPAGVTAFVCTIGAGDYDETQRRILAAGGLVAMPKYALPGMAWQGYFLDTEGNTFGCLLYTSRCV